MLKLTTRRLLECCRAHRYLSRDDRQILANSLRFQQKIGYRHVPVLYAGIGRYLLAPAR